MNKEKKEIEITLWDRSDGFVVYKKEMKLNFLQEIMLNAIINATIEKLDKELVNLIDEKDDKIKKGKNNE